MTAMRCPRCDAVFEDATAADKRDSVCPHCGEVFRVPGASPGPYPKVSAAQPGPGAGDAEPLPSVLPAAAPRPERRWGGPPGDEVRPPRRSSSFKWFLLG